MQMPRQCVYAPYKHIYDLYVHNKFKLLKCYYTGTVIFTYLIYFLQS
jgi:hypothetical protein